MSMLDNIECLLRQHFTVEHIEIADDSWRHAGHTQAGGGGHYRVTIVAPNFTGKSTVERHRLVYGALDTLMRHDIHALVLHTRAPGEAA